MTLPFIDDVAASISFSPGQPCSGGEHLSVQYTLTIGGRSITRPLQIGRSETKANTLTPADADAFAAFLIRVLAEQVTLANLRTALATKIVDFTVAG